MRRARAPSAAEDQPQVGNRSPEVADRGRAFARPVCRHQLQKRTRRYEAVQGPRTCAVPYEVTMAGTENLYRTPPDPGFVGGYNWAGVIAGVALLITVNIVATQFIAYRFAYQV